MKEFLKQFDVLVLVIRWMRGTIHAWRQVVQQYRFEKDRTATLDRRELCITSYIEENSCCKLQIGTGNNPLEGWLNTDLEPMSPDIIYLNALETLPFEDQSIDFVFSEHMIEHINYKDALFMLGECYRVLKLNGRIRVATPNLEQIIGLYSSQKTESQKRYLEWSSKEQMGLYSPDLNEFQQWHTEWALNYEHFQRFYPDKGQDTACLVVNHFFRSYGHKFLFDNKSLKAALEEVGFVAVANFKPGVSDDVNLSNLESHNKIIGDEMNLFETMVLEAFRPSP